MSENGKETAVDSATDIPNEESEVTTMSLKDVLELEDALIEETAAVLGAANDKKCSYTEVLLHSFLLFTFSIL